MLVRYEAWDRFNSLLWNGIKWGTKTSNRQGSVRIMRAEVPSRSSSPIMPNDDCGRQSKHIENRVDIFANFLDAAVLIGANDFLIVRSVAPHGWCVHVEAGLGNRTQKVSPSPVGIWKSVEQNDTGFRGLHPGLAAQHVRREPRANWDKHMINRNHFL